VRSGSYGEGGTMGRGVESSVAGSTRAWMGSEGKEDCGVNGGLRGRACVEY
jgi:hypothetical protein